jgi:hypothetical protein
MRKHKKIIFIVVAAVLVIGATLGAVAFAQADDQSGNTTGTSTNATSLFDKVAAAYQQLTGTNIDSAQLQKAFDQVRQDQQDQALDNMLSKLVASGKITQAQADAYKTWLKNKPATTFTDEYKQWMQSEPQGLPFGPGGGHTAPMPRLGGFGRMFRR